MNLCPNCGASVRPGARFCTACGYRLGVAASNAGDTEESPAASSIDQSAAQMGSMGASPASDVTASPGGDVAGTSLPGGETSGAGMAAAGPESAARDDDTLEPTEPLAGSDPNDVLSPEEGEPVGEPYPDAYSSGSDAVPDEPVPGETEEDRIEGDVDVINPAPSEVGDDDQGPTSVSDLDESAIGDAGPAPGHGDTSGDSGAESSPIALSAPSGQESGDAAGGRPAATDSTGGGRPSSEPVLAGSPGADTSSASDRGTGSATGITWSSDGSDTTGTATGNATSNTDTPQDVVIDTTVVHETSWSPDDAWSSGPAPASQGESDGSSVSSRGADANGMTGGARADTDWEPWGQPSPAGEAEPDGSGPTDTSGDELSYSAVGTPAGRPAADEASGAPASTPSISDLIGQLNQVVEQLSDKVTELEADGAGAGLAGSGFSALSADVAGALDEAIDPSTLDALRQQAIDIEGKEWDIRALQRFAERHQEIVDLIGSYERQRDLLTRLSSLTGSAGERR